MEQVERVQAVHPSLADSDAEDSFVRQFALTDEPSSRPPLPGEWLGGTDGQRFHVIEGLGQGGMGQVLRAWDEVLHRAVALKFLAPQAERLEASLLRREARAVARLDHENVVRLLDLGEWRDALHAEPVPFLVMECLEGESLASRLRRGPLAVGEALHVLGAVATGLAHAHARQVIHRDLKPGNVFLTRDGRVKLLDFGLARIAALGTASAAWLPFAGTPAYMAPEQWRGAPQDARTDLWAAGLLLFEMLAGVPAFHAETFEALRTQVLSEAPAPSLRGRRLEVPDAVERILARTLAREPERRFPSAEALREQVDMLARRLDSRREASPDAAQHRQVTLVACRLSGLPSHLGSDEVNELVDAFQKGCQRLLHRHGCTVILSVGDELLGCFGHPVAHEDDSEQAVRAGLELAEVLPRELPVPGLAVRVGIHTDGVVLGAPAKDSGAVMTISGEAPKVAAWLASQAEPGTVLLGPSTYALVRGVFDMERLGSRPFTGLARTVDLEVYRPRRERTSASRFERARARGDRGLSSFVGREPELQTLLDLWSEARSGRGALALVRGEAGIGKSRLLRELRSRARSEPAWCWTAQCWRQASNSALFPVIDLLRHVLGLAAADEPARKRERLDARLGALGLSLDQVELIALLLSLPVAEHSRLLLLTPDERKEQTRDALTVLLLHLTVERPVLLMVEDVQWADASTLEFLGFVLKHLPSARLLLVLSVRSGFQLPWPVRTDVHILELARLLPVHAEALAMEVARGGTLNVETVRRLVAKAEGVPLFIEELMRMVLERAPHEGDPLASPIPASLYELLAARLDLLSPRQKALAQLCSVVSRGVTTAVLAPLSGEKDEERLVPVLSELIEAGVLQQKSSGPSGRPAYRFRHALIQDAAYQSLPRGTRRRLHAQVARFIEERFPQLAEVQPECLAHHYAEAGEAAQAIRYLLRAGDSAYERSAYVEATNHLRQGLALLKELPDTAMRLREEIALRTVLGFSLVEVEGMGAPETEQTHVRLQELLRQVDAAWLPSFMSYWAPFAYFYAQGRLPAARELASRLLDVGQRLGNDEFLGHGHRMLASVLRMQGELTAAGAALGHALVLCAKPGVEPPQGAARKKKYGVVPLAAAHAAASIFHALSGHPERARDHGQDALRLAKESGHLHTLLYVQTYLALTHQLCRDGSGVLDWADRGLPLAQLHGCKVWLERLQCLRAWALADLGHPWEGLQRIQACLDTWNRTGGRLGLPELCAMQADIHLRLGALDEGMAAVTEGLEWVARNGERMFEAELYRLQGELLRGAARDSEASQSFHWALDIARRQGARLLELRTAVSLGRQLQSAGRPEEARILLERSSDGLDLQLDLLDFQEAKDLLRQLSSVQ